MNAFLPLPTLIENYLDECNSAHIYRYLAAAEADPRLREIYQRLAETEERHAAAWAERIRAAGGQVPTFHPPLRTRLLLWLAARFGPALILPALQGMERGGASGYAQQGAPAAMSRQEQSHALVLGQIARLARGGLSGSALAQLEGRHRATGGNALRAAVLGANDGLVSNLSLVMGVAGAALDNRTVLITGLAGLLAGAISMALGEWLSVQSARELYGHQIAIEAEEIAHAPEEEAEELALIYEARGLAPEQARALATQILSDPQNALDTLAREELGVDPQELGGSAWEAALTSFVLFALGAIFPVLPFAFFSGFSAVIASILFSILALFGLGAAITLFTGRSVLYSGLRMVIFGLLAAAVTFGIGRLIGVSIAG
ncbi:VIT1/CCC1 transporter family protein [Thermanaerothrix daxensis]|uniref:VIT1/CCC1 transporter family protein n=1 Tax=Thermanaerothrix daxensis TaxID=869279 RepID=UPI000B24F5F1|nr:VIT1/CCC1 family protein [Thermanaerothrix daxensis]